MQSKDDELKTQVSDSSLRELNSRLVIEIDKLRREKDSLISKNTELLARIVELEQSIKEDAENTKLRDAELNTRIFELERSAKENEELRNRVAKLEQHQYIDTNTISLDDETNSNDTSEQIISCNEESRLEEPLLRNNTSNSDIYQDSATTTSPAETISFASQSNLRRPEEKVENEFRDQELLSTPENTIPKISISPNKNASIHEAEKSLLNKDLNIQDTKLSSSESKSSIISSSNQEQSAISSEIKIPYNQKVEQGLICELSTFINEKSLSNPIPDRQILENTLDGDDSTPGSASRLAHLFDKAKKTGQKEILRWYCYSEEFEKKVTDISFKNELNDQMARTQIYNEMIPFLPGIKREYLRKKTQKARNIYTLFKEIGIDKIKQVTYSADAISSLTGVQIQNIIKLFSEKPNVELVNEQADIGEKTLPEIEVSTQETSTSSSTPSIQKSHTSSHSMTASGNSEDIIGERNKSSGLKKVSEVEVSEVSTSLPETETINISNKSRPSISVLPDDPKEKQKHVIKMVLEKAPNLSLKYSSGDNDYFDCSITCPLCNNNHKNENIKNYIKGKWGSGDYVNTCTYRLRCWGNKYQNSIQIVTVKA